MCTTMAVFHSFGSCAPSKIFIIAAAKGPDKVITHLLRKAPGTPSSRGQALSLNDSKSFITFLGVKTTVVRCSGSKVDTQFKSSRVKLIDTVLRSSVPPQFHQQS
ncbi:hypothetical protein HHI36_021035 [Cryptolaemus montrouzieri]|uniref:Uncharacterized protein n=1 Tax=Cryptolaemus montrouzieri TaxID=559131 RepID=A0ABD2MVI1_9CUCU